MNDHDLDINKLTYSHRGFSHTMSTMILQISIELIFNFEVAHVAARLAAHRKLTTP